MDPISRRLFLGASVATFAVAHVLPAFAAAPSGEAPMLKALVDAGTLPPLAGRLPVNPMVVTPLHEVVQIRRHLAQRHRRRRFLVHAVPLSGL